MNKIISFLYILLSILIGLLLIIFIVLVFICDSTARYLSRLRDFFLALAYPLN